MNIKKLIKWGIIIIFLSILIYLYRFYNPVENNYFPKCPFRELTGYKCPGCGSQTAIHYLLNLDIKDAFKENMLLVLSIPYLLTGLVFELIKNRNENLLKWRKRLFGPKAIKIILLLIILFWILRNVNFMTYG